MVAHKIGMPRIRQPKGSLAEEIAARVVYEN